MREIIVRYNDGNDHMAVRGGEYVQDLVRCKECKHWWRTTGANYGDCAHFALDTIADAFCSYGEVRDG